MRVVSFRQRHALGSAIRACHKNARHGMRQRIFKSARTKVVLAWWFDNGCVLRQIT